MPYCLAPVRSRRQLSTRGSQSRLCKTYTTRNSLRSRRKLSRKLSKSRKLNKGGLAAMAAQVKIEAKAQKQSDRLKAKEAEEAQKQLEVQPKASVDRPRGGPKSGLWLQWLQLERRSLEPEWCQNRHARGQAGLSPS